MLKLIAIFILITSSAWAFKVDVADAPTNDLSLTLHAILSAKQSIALNAYELTSPEITHALLEQIKKGIQVEILEEGQPVGGMPADGKKARALLVDAMRAQAKDDHFYEMTSAVNGHRRFRFDHGKYAVIDGASLLIGSENYSPTGNPVRHRLGNRGWEVFIHDEAVSQNFLKMFESDSAVSAGDIRDLTSNDSKVRMRPKRSHADDDGGPNALDASAAYKITSPDTSESLLIKLLDEAQTSVDIEQMTFPLTWGPDGSAKSPLAKAVLTAARRGVEVRVLLNDETAFGRQDDQPPREQRTEAALKNPVTVDLFNSIAKKEGLKLAARIADVKRMGVDYIHNKGALSDGRRTLISSINWNWNAVENNRETAVLLISPEIHQHYEKLFDKDWAASSPR